MAELFEGCVSVVAAILGIILVGAALIAGGAALLAIIAAALPVILVVGFILAAFAIFSL